MNPIALSNLDLALAACLVLVHAALSLALSLGLGRMLVVAVARMVIQLALLGLVLQYLFEAVSPWLTLLAALVMIGFAGHEAVARLGRKFRGAWGHGISTVSVLLAAMLIMTYVLTTQVQPDPWYNPRYAIPLLGMLLGNALTGIALGLNTLTATASRERAAIEAQLTLGATIWRAMRPTLREAMRSGLIPIINAMVATGLISIPGMMTGQMLAGASPESAIRYQLLVMFMLAGATGIGVFAAVHAGTWRLTDARHRLRLDRLAETKTE
jgi:putative ABC transport system permease protein